MTLLHFLKTTLILLLVFTIIVPIYLAEGALHIHQTAVPAPDAADYLARINGATWQPARQRAADGVQLQGWYFHPSDFNGAAVLLLHGIGDTRLGMTGHLPYLLLNGYAVLMPDARGH